MIGLLLKKFTCVIYFLTSSLSARLASAICIFADTDVNNMS